MKIKLEENYKRIYTVEEYEQAKVVIAFEKENDEATPAWWAGHALAEYSRMNPGISADTVLKAEAYTAKNRRAYNLYSDSDGNESGHMDTVIKAYATGWDTRNEYKNVVIYIVACLSDLWQLDGETDYSQHMYVQVFKEDR